jgi:Rieske Fe-S protein
MFLSVETPHRSIRPHLLDTGEAYLVIEGDEHRTGEDATADEHFGALEDWARSRIPELNQFRYRWSAQDYMPADGIPYVGRLANSAPGMLVATGFKKWGMSNGTAAAMMLSDLIVGRENVWLEAFDATRLGLPQGLGEMVKSNVDVARQFVGARLASVPGVSDVGPGTGSIVDYEGTRLAVYRNEQGNVTALSARCTHMGCLVGFNPAERSWDCPCHGSRFALDGQVLEGPAVAPLEEVDLSQPGG